MNPYTVAILAALLFEYGLFALAERLNRRALVPELPEEFAEVLDPERYRRSQEYTLVRSRFALLVRTALLTALLTFWSWRGFERLDAALSGLGETWRGLAFLGALLLLRTLVALPFRWWSTFRIEERFGFNRTTARTFWADTGKSLLVTAAIVGPLLVLALSVLARWQPHWTPRLLLIPLSIGALVLLLQVLSATVILPLFLRFRPLEEGPVKQALLSLAHRVGFAARDVHVVDGSRRSSKANAFFTGFGRARRIALFDTLLERHSPDELLAVVAHELGHWRLRHVWLWTASSVVSMSAIAGVLLFAVSDPRLTEALGVTAPAPHAALVAFALAFTPVEVALGIATQALSRRHEFAADAFAAETTGDPEAMARALKRLSADSLTNLTPHPFYVALHHSHPPVLARVAALRA